MTEENFVVLHCAETIKGGIATYLRDLVPLQCAEFAPSRIAIVVPASQAKELGTLDGVYIFEYRDSGTRVINALRLGLAVRRIAKKLKPLTIHIHSTFAGASVRPLLIKSKSLIVYCPHGWAFDRPLSRIQRTLVSVIERIGLMMTDVVVCISNHEKQLAIKNKLPEKKIEIVLNGVGVRPAGTGLEHDLWVKGKKRILYVGRFDKQKGVDILVAAMRELSAEAHAVLVGGAVVDDGFVDNFPNSVTYVGWAPREKIESYFDAADVLIVPSRWEGFGLVAVEAMRAGLPVIASRVGGLSEVIQDKVTGILIEPDSPSAIVTAIRSLDDFTLKKMGQAGRQRYQEKFTMGRVHEELMSVYGL